MHLDPRRIWSALLWVLLAGVSVVNLMHVARRVSPPARVIEETVNPVLREEQRFAKVVAKLHEHHVPRTVGYLADQPPEKLRADKRAMEEYFITQFVLAPWVLDANSTAFEWIVVNLRQAALAERLPAGFRVVEDFGHGVLLLRRSSP